MSGGRSKVSGDGAVADLLDTQRLLRRLVTAPLGVAEALAGRPGVPGWFKGIDDVPDALSNAVHSDDRLDAARRLDVYANAYFYRLLDCLSDDYAALRWLLGDAPFNDLVTSYLVAYPSTAPSLRDLGASVGAFIETHAAAAFVRRSWPGAAGVSRLEWALVEVFDAREETALDREMLVLRDPAAWAALPLALRDCVRCLPLDDTAAALVSRHRAGGPAPPPADASPVSADSARSAAATMVWRERERSVFAPVDGSEATALLRLRDGMTFGDLCIAAAAEVGEGGAAELAAGWLAGWVDRAWLRAPEEGAPAG